MKWKKKGKDKIVYNVKMIFFLNQEKHKIFNNTYNMIMDITLPTCHNIPSFHNFIIVISSTS